MINKSDSLTIRPGLILRSLLALPAAYGLLLYFTNGVNPVYVLVLTGLLTLVLEKLLSMRRNGSKIKMRTILCGGFFSVCLSAVLFIRRKMHLEAAVFDPVHKIELIYLALIFLAVLPISILLLECCKSVPILSESSRKKRILLSILFCIVIAAFYAVSFMCFAPSISTYDSLAVLQQIRGDIGLSNWHPILYTMLMSLFTGHDKWDLQTGVALFSLAQMLFMVLSAGYTVNWMMKKHLHPFFGAAAALYYALPPVFAVFSMTVWKDVPFGAAAVLFMLCIYDLMESDGKLLRSPIGAIRFVLLAYLVGMLRHNGFYVVIVISLILLLIFLIKRNFKALLLIILPVLLIAGSNELAYRMGVAKTFSSEAFSIPAQQIARTYTHGGEISDAQMEELKLYFALSKLKKYKPFLADPAKNSIKQDYFNDNKAGFIRLWTSLLKSNPQSYLSAYLLQTHGYWNPGDKTEVILDPSANAFSAYDVEKEPLIYIEGVNSGNLRPLDFISIGLMVWIMLFTAVSLFERKQYRKLTAMLPILGVWGTIMIAAPTDCSFRYIYALPLALPVILFMLLAKDGPIIKDEPAEETADGQSDEESGSKAGMTDVYSFSETAKASNKNDDDAAKSSGDSESKSSSDTDNTEITEIINDISGINLELSDNSTNSPEDFRNTSDQNLSSADTKDENSNDTSFSSLDSSSDSSGNSESAPALNAESPEDSTLNSPEQNAVSSDTNSPEKEDTAEESKS